MNIPQSNKSNKKKILIISLIATLLIAGGAAAFYLTQQNDPSNEENSKTSQDTPTTDTNKKGETPAESLPDNSQGTTTEDVPVSSTASAKITRLEQQDMTVYFAADISNTTTAGRCVVSFTTTNDRPVIREFDSTQNGANRSCNLDLSALEFSYLGEWKVTLRYYEGNTQVVTEGLVTIS